MRFLSLLIFIILLIPGKLQALGMELSMPLEDTMQRIDTLLLRGPEGIWEYPGDDVKVVILADPAEGPGKYTLRVVEAFDTRLHNGDLMGILLETARQGEYELLQYTRRKRGLFDLPGRCLVKLTPDSRSLLIDPASKLSIKFNPSYILPKFWRMVRTTVKETRQPTEGLVRVYPSGDGKGILYEKKRYL